MVEMNEQNATRIEKNDEVLTRLSRTVLDLTTENRLVWERHGNGSITKLEVIVDNGSLRLVGDGLDIRCRNEFTEVLHRQLTGEPSKPEVTETSRAEAAVEEGAAA